MPDEHTSPPTRPMEGGAPHLTPELLHLLAAAQVGEPTAIEQLMAQVAEGLPSLDAPRGTDLLLFLSGAVPCAAPLAALREIIPHLPAHALLPSSPPWLLGVFPLRTEMLGLVDPAPHLLGIPTSESYVPIVATRHQPIGATFPLPPAGPLGLSMTIIAGEGPRQLGLAVSAVGDVVRADDDEIAGESQALLQAASPVHERYIAGIYTPHQTHDHYTILHIERLLDDLIDALDRSEEDGHG